MHNELKAIGEKHTIPILSISQAIVILMNEAIARSNCQKTYDNSPKG